MSDLVTAVPTIRDSVAAILRLHVVESGKGGKGKSKAPQIQAALVGSAFCIVEDKYLLTAYHIFNGGKQRDPGDRFYAFTVPGNGLKAYHFPVISFPVEKPERDVAVLEIGPCAIADQHIPSLPISFSPQPDGSRVVTVGFPAPEISKLSVDPQLNYKGGQFFLKSHANEGIVSSQYMAGDVLIYELSVGWHHGESGGPIAALTDPPAAFSLMQHYRNVQSPHGTVAGPHRGHALSVIRDELISLGVELV
ncbi:MAG: serine protease [Dehalococcoidia bacterium]